MSARLGTHLKGVLHKPTRLLALATIPWPFEYAAALPPAHGALGVWDEVISWIVFITVAVVVGLFFYQQWREGNEDEVEDDVAQALLSDLAAPPASKQE